jgi:hypothetical protein
MLFHYVTKEPSRFSQLPLPLCYCGISLAFAAKETHSHHLSTTTDCIFLLTIPLYVT